MSDNIKDQEMSDFKVKIEAKNFEQAQKSLSDLNLSTELDLYYQSFIKYSEGDLVKSRQLLEQSMGHGYYNFESIKALKVLKYDLNINSVEAENDWTDQLHLSLKTLPIDVVLSVISIMTLAISFLFIKKMFKSVLISALILAAFSWFTYDLSKKDIYLSVEEVIVRNGPSKIFKEVQVLYPGMKFIVEKEFKNWKYISYPKSHRGWIERAKVLTL